MPPQTNATITAVAGQGTAEDWDTAAVAGAAKWVGEARAYYRENLTEVRGEGTVSVVLRRELIVDYADLDAMALDTDDVISIRLDGGKELVASAAVIPRKLLGGIPQWLQTSRVVLDDVAAAG